MNTATSATDNIAWLLSSQESQHIDRKRAIDVDSKRGKAAFVKDILALANTTRPESPGYLLVGVDDWAAGGSIVGLAGRLDPDQLCQIIATYTSPVPSVQIKHYELEGKIVASIEVSWTNDIPYFAIRDCEDVLSSSVGYTRRGATIGTLKPPEIIALAGHKGIGAEPSSHPLLVGFIDAGHWHGPNGPVFRMENVSEISVDGIDVAFDVTWKGNEKAFGRLRSYRGFTLHSGESCEHQITIDSIYVYVGDTPLNPRHNQLHRNLDIVARVRYRSSLGKLIELSHSLFMLD